MAGERDIWMYTTLQFGLLSVKGWIVLGLTNDFVRYVVSIKPDWALYYIDTSVLLEMHHS